jgi:1-deoxy-D-xylulose-5-phosphate reductoisomerase
MIGLTILGVTGSIGQSTLEVVRLHKDEFNIIALSAYDNWQKMVEIVKEFEPKFVVMVDKKAALELKSHLNVSQGTSPKTEILVGAKYLDEVAGHTDTDYVMAAIVGSAGMSSTLSAAKAGKRILLANKESMVLAGDLLLKTAKENKAQIIPVDSEHSAIFQCLESGQLGVSKIQLTASGGPFLNTSIAKLKNITPDEACNHPNWEMGRKISVDSATMMNKGLEVIEAYYLFGFPVEQIDVVIHPQSIVHSSVYYQDGSVISQLGKPDMRTAISYALFYPKRDVSGVKSLDLTRVSPLEFFQPDYEKFKGLKLVFDSLKVNKNSILGAINAANEVAVDAFLNNQISFLDIVDVIDATLQKHNATNLENLQHIIDNDKESRFFAKKVIHR